MHEVRYKDQYSVDSESQFLQYVLYVLKNSRSKRQAEARISGLVNKRLEANGTLVTYSDEMIKSYELENKKKNEK